MSTPKTEITSLVEWRQNPQLLGWALKLFNSREWKLLNYIMQEGEHVRLFDSPGISSDQKLGRIEGWDLRCNRLKEAALPLSTQGPMPEATFLPADEPQAPEKD